MCVGRECWGLLKDLARRWRVLVVCGRGVAAEAERMDLTAPENTQHSGTGASGPLLIMIP